MRMANIIASTFKKSVFFSAEMSGVVVFFMLLSTHISPITSILELWFRLILGYLIYQIILINVLSYINNEQRKAILNYVTALKKSICYVEKRDLCLKREILIGVERQLRQGFFNNHELRESFVFLRNNLSNISKRRLEIELARAEDAYERSFLKCKYSLALRFLSEML